MADKTFYTKSEVDELISNTKDKLIKKIDETIVVGNEFPSTPKVADNTLTIKIIKTE